MRSLLLLACFFGPLQAEVVDRIAIVIGRNVVTELQIDEELRVTAFLNNQPVTRDSATRRAAASRLIAQLLVERDMRLSHYPLPDPVDVDKYVAQVRAALSGYKGFDAALRAYSLTPEILRQHLELQLITLRFIEFRFRPDHDVSPNETVERRMDQALDAWLEDARKQANIEYLDRTLQ